MSFVAGYTLGADAQERPFIVMTVTLGTSDGTEPTDDLKERIAADFTEMNTWPELESETMGDDGARRPLLVCSHLGVADKFGLQTYVPHVEMPCTITHDTPEGEQASTCASVALSAQWLDGTTEQACVPLLTTPGQARCIKTAIREAGKNVRVLTWKIWGVEDNKPRRLPRDAEAWLMHLVRAPMSSAAKNAWKDGQHP